MSLHPLIVRRIAILAALGATTASCISFPGSRSGIPADPLYLEDRGEAVFAQYLIPVAEQYADYRVRSGPFIVDDVWGYGAIEERVQCGVDPRVDPAAHGARIRMSVTLRISHSTTGSRVALASSGRTLPNPESEASSRCRLRESFVQEILAAVAGELPGDGIARPGVLGPRPGLPDWLPGTAGPAPGWPTNGPDWED